MRLHSDTLTMNDVRIALRTAQLERNPWKGEKEPEHKIARHVTLKRLSQHRSSARLNAFEVQLEAAERDRGRRAGNSGAYGAMRPEADGYAATYDEWGWLLAALYALDPQMIVGSPKYAAYEDRAQFDDRTAYHYNVSAYLEEVYHWGGATYGDDPWPYVPTRNRGRTGANRHANGTDYWGLKNQPRELHEWAVTR